MAILHWGPGDLDYLLEDGFAKGVSAFGLVGTDRVASTSDGAADLQQLSRDGNSLILTFSVQEPAFSQVTSAFPDTRYVLFDQAGTDANTTYVTFKDQESSYLAGAAAAMTTKTRTIGFVGGVDLPAVWHFQAGFEAGARSVDPDVRILATYLSEPPDLAGFRDAELGRAAADAMYAGGADVVFEAAGYASFGSFEAAAVRSETGGTKRWAIGVDSDQFQNVGILPGVVDPDRWRAHILTSVVKRWDQAIYAALGDFAHGALVPGVSAVGLDTGAVDIVYTGGYIDALRPRLDALRADVIAGRVVVPCLPQDKRDEAAAAGASLDCHR